MVPGTKVFSKLCNVLYNLQDYCVSAVDIHISQSPLHSFDSCNHALGSTVENCGGEQVFKKEKRTGGKDL